MVTEIQEFGPNPERGFRRTPVFISYNAIPSSNFLKLDRVLLVLRDVNNGHKTLR